MKIKTTFKKAKSINLDPDKKQAVKNELLNFISANPAQVDIKIHTRVSYKYSYAIIASILIISLTGGTSFAAESALPGETLYSFKTKVNEKVKEIFAGGKEAKAKLQAALIEERLEEIQELASSGRLDQQRQAQAERLLNSRIQKFEELSGQIASSSAAIEKARLYNRLEAHRQVIESLLEDFEGTENLSSIVSQIQLVRTKMRAEASEVDLDEDTSVLEENAGSQIQNLQQRVEERREELYEKALEQIEEQIGEGQSSLREGSILNQQGNEDDAREILRESEWAAERGERILEIHERIRVKSRIEDGELKARYREKEDD